MDPEIIAGGLTGAARAVVWLADWTRVKLLIYFQRVKNLSRYIFNGKSMLKPGSAQVVIYMYGEAPVQSQT